MELEDCEMENAVTLAIQKVENLSTELYQSFRKHREMLANEILNGEFNQLIDLSLCEQGKKKIRKATRILRILRG